jgi:hypothetical protein
MRVLITGSRTWTDQNAMWASLDDVQGQFLKAHPMDAHEIVVVHLRVPALHPGMAFTSLEGALQVFRNRHVCGTVHGSSGTSALTRGSRSRGAGAQWLCETVGRSSKETAVRKDPHSLTGVTGGAPYLAPSSPGMAPSSVLSSAACTRRATRCASSDESR